MSDDAEIVDRVIRARATDKVVCDLEDREPVPAHVENPNRRLVLKAIETAGWAPFHYSREVDGISEPWRVHALWNKEVVKLADYLANELHVKTKEPKLAAACSALVLVTWLPEQPDCEKNEEIEKSIVNVAARNEEHLAAASAMVQNFLLMLTVHGMGNYWSSGGKLRSSEVMEYLKIPKNERLLAAIFIEYPQMKNLVGNKKQRKPGALRKKRSQKWIRVVSEEIMKMKRTVD